IRDGDPLTRDGLPVLEAGGTDFVVGDAQASRDLSIEILGSHGALLDPEVDMVAAAARLVSGDFLDLEVFGLLLDQAANAWQVLGHQGERCKRVEGHGNFVGQVFNLPYSTSGRSKNLPYSRSPTQG